MISLIFAVIAAECNGALIKGELTCSDVIEGTLSHATPSRLVNYNRHTCTSVGQQGPEEVYRFRCQKTGAVELHIHNLSCDVDIYVLDSSCSPSQGCIHGEVNPNTHDDQFSFECKEGENYYIVLEGYGLQHDGCSSANYHLSFVAGGGCLEDCDDRIDNDHNGKIDCDDSSCATDPVCAQVIPVSVPKPFHWGPSRPINLGPLHEGTCVDGTPRCRESFLNLEGTSLSVPIHVSLVHPPSDVSVEVFLNNVWTEAEGATIELTPELQQVPFRMRMDRCCRAAPDQPMELHLISESTPTSLDIQVSVSVKSDSLWDCWWPVVAAGTTAATLAWLLYGFIRPSRFPSQAGLLLSHIPDMEESAFYAIRAHKRTGVGWYRDARVFICDDFALRGWNWGKIPGKVAELRASGKSVRIRPTPGRALEWQDLDGEWQPVPEGENILPAGRLFRLSGRSDFYFELRWRRG